MRPKIFRPRCSMYLPCTESCTPGTLETLSKNIKTKGIFVVCILLHDVKLIKKKARFSLNRPLSRASKSKARNGRKAVVAASHVRCCKSLENRKSASHTSTCAGIITLAVFLLFDFCKFFIFTFLFFPLLFLFFPLLF